MTKQDDSREHAMLQRWQTAERSAERGDYVELVKLLRHFALHPGDQTHEVPNLYFVAGLLDEKMKKPKKRVGRPAGSNLQNAAKALRAGWAVEQLRRREGLTVEQAVEKAAKKVLMSPSAIRKHYYECRRLRLVKSP